MMLIYGPGRACDCGCRAWYIRHFTAECGRCGLPLLNPRTVGYSSSGHAITATVVTGKAVK